jgi:hypothetical protein
MDPFNAWVEQTALSVWLREAPTIFAFPLVLIFHTVGLGFLVGPALALDLRLLGVGRGMPVDGLRKFMPVAWAGFVMNAVSGLLLLIAYPTKNLTNPIFYLKLALIAAGIVMLRMLARRQEGDPGARTLAVMSIVCWASAITAGRLLAYTYKHLLSGE